MRLLEANPNLSQRDLADALGLSLGSANYCLRALIDAGLVKVRNFKASKHKLSYVYILTPQGVATKARMTRGFLARKQAEYEALKAEIEGLKREVRRGSERSATAQRTKNFS